MKVPFSYLTDQFRVPKTLPHKTKAESRTADILEDIYKLVETGDYTLGYPVQRFEEAFAEKLRVKYAVGVSNGTDALFLAMKALGIKKDEPVITAPNSFLATAGAIVQAGAQVVFRDVWDDYLLQPVEQMDAWTIPVDLTGNVCPMDDNRTIHDAAQAVGAEYQGKSVAAMGAAACFSLHVLKNIHAWNDGGVITTNDYALAHNLRVMRNHGLQDRDTCIMPGYNHRLSSMAAIPAYHLLKELDEITDKRIANATRYDAGLKDCPGITIPPRDPNVRQVFHTYVIQCDRRDALKDYLMTRGVDTRIHYPVPIHLQPGYQFLGYQPGDFPICESQANRILSLPIHEYLTPDMVNYTIEAIRDFDFYCQF